MTRGNQGIPGKADGVQVVRIPLHEVVDVEAGEAIVRVMTVATGTGLVAHEVKEITTAAPMENLPDIQAAAVQAITASQPADLRPATTSRRVRQLRLQAAIQHRVDRRRQQTLAAT